MQERWVELFGRPWQDSPTWFGLEWWQWEKKRRRTNFEADEGTIIHSVVQRVFFCPLDQEFNSMCRTQRRRNEIWEEYRHKEWGFKTETISRPFLSVWNYLGIRKVGETEDVRKQASRWKVQTINSRRADLNFQANWPLVVRRCPGRCYTRNWPWRWEVFR